MDTTTQSLAPQVDDGYQNASIYPGIKTNLQFLSRKTQRTQKHVF